MYGFQSVTVPAENEVSTVILGTQHQCFWADAPHTGLHTTAAIRSQFWDATQHLWQRVKLLCQGADKPRDTSLSSTLFPTACCGNGFTPNQNAVWGKAKESLSAVPVKPLLPPPKERCRPDGFLLWHIPGCLWAPAWIMLALTHADLSHKDWRHPKKNQQRKATHLT